jgi:predicted class III extradiol MEMO1 family dioxygenase
MVVDKSGHGLRVLLPLLAEVYSIPLYVLFVGKGVWFSLGIPVFLAMCVLKTARIMSVDFVHRSKESIVSTRDLPNVLKRHFQKTKTQTTQR